MINTPFVWGAFCMRLPEVWGLKAHDNMGVVFWIRPTELWGLTAIWYVCCSLYQTDWNVRTYNQIKNMCCSLCQTDWAVRTYNQIKKYVLFYQTDWTMKTYSHNYNNMRVVLWIRLAELWGLTAIIIIICVLFSGSDWLNCEDLQP